MKQNTLNITLFTVTLVALTFVSFITVEIYVQSIEEAEKTKAAETETKPQNNLKLIYSPDGKYLILNDNKGFKAYEVKSGKKVQEIKTNGVPSFTFGPDSKSLTFIDKDNKIKILNLINNQVINLLDEK